jgi:16S rRNA (guanine527-N7)-methyltransferase
MDVITARALAPVAELLRLGRGFLRRRTVALLLKGAKADAELTEAARDWKMTVKRHPSLSHPEGVLLELRDIHARKRA